MWRERKINLVRELDVKRSFFQVFLFLSVKGYLFNFATAATKKISESVAETAQTIKKSVEEGKIDSIIDKVFYF